MSDRITKRVAGVFLEANDAERVQKRLALEAKHWADELARVPKGSKEALQATKMLTQIQGQYQKLAQGVRASNADIKVTDGLFNMMRGSLGKLMGPLSAVFGGAAILSGSRKSVEAYQEHERAVAKIDVALEKLGKQSGLTTKQMEADAQRIQENSLFSDEQVLNDVSARLLTFGNIVGDNFIRANQAAVDLSTVMDKDLAGASMALGKALTSPTEGLAGLQRIGVRLNDTQKESIKRFMEQGDLMKAQGVILDELEKRFKGHAAAQAEVEGGQHRLNVAIDEFAEGVGGKLNPSWQAFSGGLADAVNGMAEWLGLTQKQSEQLEDQRIEMNALFEVLKDGNVTQEQRSQLIARINKEYGIYLPNLLDEASSLDDITAAQRDANQALLERIELVAKQEVIQEAMDELVKAQTAMLRSQVQWEKGMQTGFAGIDFVGTHRAIREQQQDVAKLTANYNELVATLGNVGNATAGAFSPGASTDPDASGQGDPEKLKKLRDLIRDAQNALFADRLDGAEREVKQERDKWNAIINENLKFSDEVARLEGIRDERVAMIRQKWAKKELEDLQKLDDQIKELRRAAEVEAMGHDQQELARIRDKYQKLIDAAVGHADRIKQLEDLRDMELANKQSVQAAAQQAVADDLAERQQAQAVALAEQQLQSMNARHVRELEQAQMNGDDLTALLAQQGAERLELQAILDQAAMDSLNRTFETLYAAYDAAGINTTELQRLHGEATLALKKEQGDREVASNEEKNARLLASDKQRRNALLGVAKDTFSGLVTIMEMGGKAASEYSEFEKLVTLVQIAFDTASAISSLTKMSEANPANAVTFGGAGVAQWIAGFARIGINMGQAVALLNKPIPPPPAFAVGGATAQANDMHGAAYGRHDILSWWDDNLKTMVTLQGPSGSVKDGGVVAEPRLATFGELGTEWVAPNWQYEHPTLQPVFNWLEEIRVTRRIPMRIPEAFAVGGGTMNGRAQSGATTAAGMAGNNNNDYVFVKATGIREHDDPLAEVLHLLLDRLNQPLIATRNYDLESEQNERLLNIQNDANIAR